MSPRCSFTEHHPRSVPSLRMSQCSIPEHGMLWAALPLVPLGDQGIVFHLAIERIAGDSEARGGALDVASAHAQSFGDRFFLGIPKRSHGGGTWNAEAIRRLLGDVF